MKLRGSLGSTRQFAVFLLGGLLSAGVDIACMILLLQGGADAVMAASLGFAAGLAINYLYHAKVTFAVKVSAASVAKYFSIVGINYLTTVAMVSVADHMFASPLAGKVASVPLVAVTGFVLGRLWAFR
jgi:putative flippase GtrA